MNTSHYIPELWQNIEDWEWYEISSFWNVKSNKKNKKWWLLSQELTKKWYLRVILCKNAIPKKFLIHRLVAQEFIANRENKPQINHKNGIRTDNRVENLEWVTASENVKHSIDYLWKKSPTLWNKYGKSPLSKKVGMYNAYWLLIKVFESTTQAGTEGFESSNVSRCCNWKLPHVKWFIFKYI